jgi:hypothetical protein
MDLKEGCVTYFVFALITCVATGMYLAEARKLHSVAGCVAVEF